MLKKTIKNFKPNIVFHFAAQSLVIESQKFPRNTFETNVIGTNNLIDICKNISTIKSVVIATSDKCYFNKKAKYFSENSKILGNEPYSSSKANTEYLINNSSFFLQIFLYWSSDIFGNKYFRNI